MPQRMIGQRFGRPVRNMIYDTGLSIAKKRQSRRRRRGRRQRLPDLSRRQPVPIFNRNGNGGARQPGGYTRSSTVMPARANAQLKRLSPNERAVNSEPTSYYVRGEGISSGNVGSGAVSGKTLIQPFNSDLWPMLADKAQNFTAYTVRALRFVYQAIKGSAYNGQITCGFSKDTTLQEDTYGVPDQVLNLPCSMRFQASDTQNQLVVPASIMSQSGKSLFNPVNRVIADDEPTRYYAGAFYFVAADCTDDTNIGRWHVEYDVVLEQTQLNLEPASAEIVADVDGQGNGTVRVLRAGRFNPEVISSSSVHVSNIRPTVIYCLNDEGSCTPRVNGVLPTLLGTLSNGTTVLDVYTVPRMAVATLSFNGVEHLFSCVLSPGHPPAWASALALFSKAAPKVSRARLGGTTTTEASK